MTYFWIKEQLEKEGGDAKGAYAKSLIVGTSAPKELGHLRASDAEEFKK